MGYPPRERARRIDLFVRDFRTAEGDGPIAPTPQVPIAGGYIGPTTNGPKYPGPSSRKFCAKGPRDRGICIPGGIDPLW